MCGHNCKKPCCNPICRAWTYEGEDLECINVKKGDSYDTVIAKVGQGFCDIPDPIDNLIPLEVNIIVNADQTGAPTNGIILTCNIEGGVAPLTYQWTVVEGPIVGHTITGATTNTATLTARTDPGSPNKNRAVWKGSDPSSVAQTLVRLRVSDAVGIVDKDYYLVTIPIYV